MMNSYTKIGMTIDVAPDDEYVIRACSKREKEGQYLVTLLLGRQTFPFWYDLEEEFYMTLDQKNANKEVTEFVMSLYRTGHFQKHTESYCYYMSAMNAGLEAREPIRSDESAAAVSTL